MNGIKMLILCLKRISVSVFTLLTFQKSVSQSCNCLENLNALEKMITENYIGIKTKINAANVVHFAHFTDSLKQKASRANEFACFKILKSWLGYFKDWHTDISYSSLATLKKWLTNFPDEVEKVNLPKRGYLDFAWDRRRNGIQGVWEEETGRYRLGIVKGLEGQNIFTAYVIESASEFWAPGQIKFKLKLTASDKYEVLSFFSQDHSAISPEVKVLGSTIVLGGLSRLIKLNDKPKGRLIIKPPRAIPSFNPAFSKAENRIAILRVPSFQYEYKSQIDSLVTANKTNIINSAILIIDLRGNDGGSTASYDSILPLINTNPIILDGGNVLSGEDTRQMWLAASTDSTRSEAAITKLKTQYNMLAMNPGQAVPVFTRDTLVFAQIYDKIKRVYLLVDKDCRSATELFLLAAKQSSKVVIVGERTGGAVDYLDVSDAKVLPCPDYLYWYATSTRDLSLFGPVDNIGLKPDIFVPSKIKNWLDFTIKLAKVYNR